MARPVIEIRTEDFGDALLLHVHGDVEMASAPILREAIMSALRTQLLSITCLNCLLASSSAYNLTGFITPGVTGLIGREVN